MKIYTNQIRLIRFGAVWCFVIFVLMASSFTLTPIFVSHLGAEPANSTLVPQIGGIIEPKNHMTVYDRARIGVLKSFRANSSRITPNRKYFVLESKSNSGIFSTETWIKIAPVVNGAIDQSSGGWVEWEDDGKIPSHLLEWYSPPKP